MASTPEKGEFIEDRAIERAADDSFRHEDVSSELADLALNGPAPSNIALFAPWGSGKSGIAKLLRPRIEDADHSFVYFDAFKHRDTPLRRSFLRAATAELKPKEVANVDSRLFGQEVKQTLEGKAVRRLATWIAGGLLGALAITALVSWGLAKLKPGPFDSDFPHLFASTGGVLALVGALIGVALTALASGLSVTTTRTPVAEDDQFEQEFEDLLDKDKRVIVFVDELDRCSADDVVEALETMRVFLETTGCVFVVAVDQQSLEQALRRKARQETPIDETHPYFSTAGSYVDKIFQYQLTLPPLRPRDMTVYVRKLIEGRAGVWEVLRESKEAADVIGALAPSHVNSPRRVKVLLNSFVMAHRLAEKRVAAKQMSTLAGRRAALAKLVCLRTEFPLFAEALDEFPRLPAAMLARRRGRDPEELEGKTPRTWGRAGEFLDGKLSLAPLLIRPVAAEPGSLSADVEEAELRASESNILDAQLAGLLGYLERVERLPPIEQDLIYLHSSAGSGTELEPQIADRLAEAARDGSEHLAVEIISELPETERPRGIRHLVAILAGAEPASLDARNATRVLLAATREPGPDVDLADEAAAEIVRQAGWRPLGSSEVPAAIALCAHCGSFRAKELLALIATTEDLQDDAGTRAALISSHPELPEAGLALARESFIRSVAEDDEEAIEALTGLDLASQEVLIEGSGSLFKAEYEMRRKSLIDEGEVTPAAATTGAEEAMTDHLGLALDRLVAGSEPAARVFIRAIFGIGRRPVSDLVRDRLDRLAPIIDPKLRVALITKAWDRPAPERPLWLAPLGANELDDQAIRKLSDVAAKTWEEVIDQETVEEEVAEATLAECARLAAGSEEMTTAVVDTAIATSFSDPPDGELGWARLRAGAVLGGRLVEDRLAGSEPTAGSLIDAAGRGLAAVAVADPAARPELSAALDVILPKIGAAEDQVVVTLAERAIAAPADSLGLSRLRAAVTASAEMPHRGLDPVPEIGVGSVLEQIEIDPDASISAVVLWVRELASSGGAIWNILEHFWKAEIPPALREASASGLERLGEGHRRGVAERAFEQLLVEGAPEPANWEAVGLRQISPTWVVGELARLTGTESFDPASWRPILEVCKQLTTGVAAAQRMIGERLLLPLAREGDEGFRLAVDHLGLVGKGRAGQDVIETFGELADNEEQRTLLDRQLGEDGWAASAIRKLGNLFRGSSSSGSAGPNHDHNLEASPSENAAEADSTVEDSDGEI